MNFFSIRNELKFIIKSKSQAKDRKQHFKVTSNNKVFKHGNTVI